MPRTLGPSPERILQLTGGAQATALVGVAVDIGLFTLLEYRPMTAEELAAALEELEAEERAAGDQRKASR